ncbi:MAG: DUF58 domain-containing protein [Lachnospiraceae bacterium]
MIQLLLMLLGAGVVYFGIELWYRTRWANGLEADIKFSTDTAYPGDEVDMYEVITNRKRLPIPVLNIKIRMDRRLHFDGEDANAKVSDFSYKNDVFCIHGNQRITRTIPINCMQRGVFKIDFFEMVSSGIFMGDILHKSQSCDAGLVVYPKPVNTDAVEVVYKKIMGDVLINRRLYEDPFEFVGIREYQPFDTMNSINWKATAKSMDLKVNVHGNTSSQEVVILLNVENEGMQVMNKLQEYSISIASSLAGMLLKNGVAVSLISNGRDIETGSEITFFHGVGGLHTDRINYGLARLNLDDEIRDFSEVIRDNRDNISESCVVVLVSFAHHRQMVAELEKLQKKTSGCMWVMPHLIMDDWTPDVVTSVDILPWEVNQYE